MSSAAAPQRRLSPDEAAGHVGGLYERHARMVYGVCRAMLRDVHEAEDATQQVFLSAHKALLGGATLRDPARWLATIARNECRARIVAGMRRPLPVADEDLDLLPAVDDGFARRSQVEELREALVQLPERQREAVVLRYLYGLRYGEVATALGLSRPATEALLFRARRTMRSRLRPVAGAALVVPTVVREELALALPGFGGGSGAGVAAAGLTGGVLAKLTAGGVGAKAATAAVAVSTVGAVGAVPSERLERGNERAAGVVPAAIPVQQPTRSVPAAVSRPESSGGPSTSGSSEGSGSSSGRDHDDRSGSPESRDSSGSGHDDSRGPESGSGPSTQVHETTAPAEPASSSGPSESSGSDEPSGSQTAHRGEPNDLEPEGSSSGPGNGESSGSGSGSSGEDSDHSSSGQSGSGNSGSED